MERLITAQEWREMTKNVKDINKEELDVNKCFATIEQLLDSALSGRKDYCSSGNRRSYFLTKRERNYILETFDGLGYRVTCSGVLEPSQSISTTHCAWRFYIY